MVRRKTIFRLIARSNAISLDQIKEQISGMKGVHYVQLDIENLIIMIVHDQSVGLRLLTKPIKKGGYGIIKKECNYFDYNIFLKLSISVVFCLVLFLVHGELSGYASLFNWILTSVMCLFIALPFLRDTLSFFKTGQSFRHTLNGLAIFLIYFYGSYLYFLKKDNFYYYFFAASLIITFLYLVLFIESKIISNANNSILELTELKPLCASLLNGNEEIQKEVSLLKIGQIVRIRPNEIIPLDGEIIQGESTINEARLTGDPWPLVKRIRDDVYAGTMNVDGVIDVKISKIEKDTLLRQLIRRLEQTSLYKSKQQLSFEKISSQFTIGGIILGILVFLYWGWGQSLSDLDNAFLSCFCLLIAINPVVFTISLSIPKQVATNKASEKGILIRGAKAIEIAQSINLFAFDKTGTLTQGRPDIVGLYWDDLKESNQLETLNLIYQVTQQFSYPISKAMSEYLSEEITPISSREDLKVKFLPGKGIIAENEKYIIRIGGKRLFSETTLDLETIKEKPLQDNVVGSEVYVAVNGELECLFLLNDLPRGSASKMIAHIRQKSDHLWLLSGDNEKMVSSMSSRLGIKNFTPDLLPEEKAEVIAKLQASNYKVMMVGDGINDAPALEQADLSIALGNEKELSGIDSDVIILGHDLSKIADFFELGKYIGIIAKQNIILSFLYHLFAIPLAIGFAGPPSPLITSIFMGTALMMILLNGLRIDFPQKILK